MSVYFATIREINAVKIGSSLEPFARLAEIQTHCPLPVVIEAILPGGCEEEFTFHRRFADDHIRGEWFAINEMIEAIIAANRAVEPEGKQKRAPGLNHRSATVTGAKGPKGKPKTPAMTFEERRAHKRYREALAEMQAAQDFAAIRKEMNA